MQSKSSKKLSNSPDKSEDCNLANHPTFVNQCDDEERILGNQNNDDEILSEDIVHLHDEDILPKDVDQRGYKKIPPKKVIELHDDEQKIWEDQHNGEVFPPKDVYLHDEDILPKDVDQHDKDILPKDVVDQHFDEDILPKDVVDQHDEKILLIDVDQQNEMILTRDIDKQNDTATLPKDDEDSCDFLPKDDVEQPNDVDHQFGINDLDSEEPKHTEMMDEDSRDSLSDDSCSPQKLKTESSYGRSYKSRDKTALPYFQLPKPDLEEFLIETDKKLQDDNEIKKYQGTKVSALPDLNDKTADFRSPNVLQEVETSKSQTSKDQFIVFEIGPATPMDKFKNKFMNQTKLHAEPSPRVSPNSFQGGLQINSPLLSKEMNEKDSPGFKRLVLKEYLKQKIDEKKVAAFNRFKEAVKLDEEEEMYVESDDSAESDNEASEFQKRIEKMMAPKEKDDISELEQDKEMSENLEGSCSDSEKLGIETVDLEAAEDDSSDDDFLPNEISKKVKIVPKDHDLFHTDSEESEDEIMFTKKSKHCKRLVEDSDEESDMNSVSQNENKIGKMKKNADLSDDNSVDSGDAPVSEMNDESLSPVISSNKDANLEANNAVRESYENQKNSKNFFTATPEISSSAIPSYQPGGGFQNEDSNDSLDSIRSGGKGIVGNKFSKNGNSDSSFSSSQGIVENRSLSSTLNTPVHNTEMSNQFVGAFSTNKTPAFGVRLDDLPISQEDTDDMFASQDVDNICSGIFQDSAPPSSLLEESFLQLKDPGIAVVSEKVEDFLDAEAELSGEDDGLDDVSDDEANEVNDIIAADDDLPSDEELRDGIADLFMKRINDDDDMLIKKVQEHFLDDGELNADGAGRSRRFQWKTDDIENNDQHDMSESDNEEPDENWNAINREKAKWQQENVKQMTEDLNTEEFVKKPILRMKILGKPDNLIDLDNALPTHLKRKRQRGSLLNLDDGSASQVLKKLKAAEDSSGGSRTTKHFVFRNDVVGDVVAVTKEVAVTFTQQASSTRVEVGELSVFDNI